MAGAQERGGAVSQCFICRFAWRHGAKPLSFHGRMGEVPTAAHWAIAVIAAGGAGVWPWLRVVEDASHLKFDVGGAFTVTTKTNSTTASLRVTKKLSPETRGALKLARRFGDALICVRHRSDDKGEFRYTTVELLVEKTPIRPRTDNIVGVRIGLDEKPLQTVVRAAGGTRDYMAKVWRLPRRIVGILKLGDRITDK